MMKVFKYVLPVKVGEVGLFEIPMPYGSEPLSVDVQDGIPVLWALVANNEKMIMPRRFLLAGTGREIEAHGKFIGTYQIGWFVGHLFEAHRDQYPR